MCFLSLTLHLGIVRLNIFVSRGRVDVLQLRFKAKVLNKN